MAALRRIALPIGAAGAIVLIASALAGAIATQMALVGALSLCAAMSLMGQGTANNP